MSHILCAVRDIGAGSLAGAVRGAADGQYPIPAVADDHHRRADVVLRGD